jgi:hypothetical protein
MASKIGDLYWQVDAETSKFDKGLKSTDKTAKGMGKTFSTLSKGIVAGLGVAAVAGVGKLSLSLINAASEAEETNNKFKVTFRDVSEEAEDAASNLADSFGLSQTAAKDLLSSTGDLLAGFGFAGDEALALSDQVNTLAGDLSSFQNVDVKTASDAITKSLLGEREALKGLGIAITEADLKQLAEDKGITGTLDRQTKAALTLELAISQSGNAVGDFARSADSYANRLRTAKGATADLAAELGRFLLPAASETVGIFGKLTKGIAEYVKERNDARELEDIQFGGKKGDLQKTQEAYDDIAKKLKDVNTELEGMNESNIAAFAIERSLKQEYENTLNGLGQRLRTLQSIEQQQKDAADKLLADQAAERALEEQRQRNADAQIAAAEELKQRRFDALEPFEREKAILQDQIDSWAEFRDVPGVQTLINDLIRERNALQAEGADSIFGTIGLTQEQADAEQLLWDNAVLAAEARAEADEDKQAAIEAEKQAIQELADEYTRMGQIGLSVISDVGYALASGEDAWKAFAKSGINAVAGIIDSLAQQMLAQAASLVAAAFFSGGTSLAGVGPALAGAAAASLAAGALRGYAGTFEQGGIVPQPPGVPATGDNVMIRANPGERIVPRDEAGQKLVIMLNLDGELLANTVINDYVNKGQILIDMTRGVR